MEETVDLSYDRLLMMINDIKHSGVFVRNVSAAAVHDDITSLLFIRKVM